MCYICKKEFNTDKNDKTAFQLYHKVQDHCHYTGKYRVAAHNICNFRYKIPKEIPVIICFLMEEMMPLNSWKIIAQINQKFY